MDNIFKELCEEIKKMEIHFKAILSIPILFGKNIKTDDIKIENLQKIIHIEENYSDITWVNEIKSYTDFVLSYLVENFDNNNNNKISFFTNIIKQNIETLKEYCKEYNQESNLIKTFLDIIIDDTILKTQISIKTIECNIWESDLNIIKKIDFRKLYSEYLISIEGE